MRSNPLYNNICADRIGMYRTEACYNCPKLSECDQHYDEATGEWDYPDPSDHLIRVIVKEKGDHYKKSRHGASTPMRQMSRHRQHLVDTGRASWIPIRTTLSQAIEAAGLP